jgi:predicted CXXCH cytochrome family protein
MIPRFLSTVPLLLAGLLVLAGAPAVAGQAAQQVTAASGEAGYVGEEICAGCHGEVAAQFGLSMHARLKEWEVRGELSKCESCHGPGSKHVEASGDAQFIFGFKGKEGREASRACMSCHYQKTTAEWPGSVHFMGGLGCGDCHTIHQSRRTVLPATRPLVGTARNPDMGAVVPVKQGPPRAASLAKPEPELCFDCHKEKRAQVSYSSHHPVIERKMQCSSCHAVHGSHEESLVKAPEGLNELCTSCHPAQHGPFVFEHAAVEEGCNTCHEPHGTLANNLLKQNEPFLCLQCHEAHFHVGREGISDPISRPSGKVSNQYGSSGWRRAFMTKCTNCHPSVHGSDLPSQGISSRGGSLTR